jgi:hypothetical protein
MTGVTAENSLLTDKLYKWQEYLQKTAYLPDKTLQMIGVTAENGLPVWQTFQIIGVIAENGLPACQAL